MLQNELVFQRDLFLLQKQAVTLLAQRSFHFLNLHLRAVQILNLLVVILALHMDLDLEQHPLEKRDLILHLPPAGGQAQAEVMVADLLFLEALVLLLVDAHHEVVEVVDSKRIA